MAGDSFAHAATLLREADRERYLATLVIDEAHRPAVTALYAFNAEIAGTRGRVSNPGPGEIRLQWWSDALEGNDHGAVNQNPVADALLRTMQRYNLPAGTLQRLIAARRFDLYDDPMPDLPTFEGYAGETVSTLYQLVAMILNDGAPVEPGDAAGHLGVAHAMIGHLRAFGSVSAQGRIMLPWSVFAANGVSEGELFGGTVSEGLVEALGQIEELAAQHLRNAERAIALLPVRLRPAFAPVALLRQQLQALGQRNGSPYELPAEEPDWRKIVRLAWWTWRSRSLRPTA
jgi:phytoene synthase